MYLFMSLKLQKHFYYENERCENGNTCLLTHASTCASPQAGVTRLKSYILARARLALDIRPPRLASLMRLETGPRFAATR